MRQEGHDIHAQARTLEDDAGMTYDTTAFTGGVPQQENIHMRHIPGLRLANIGIPRPGERNSAMPAFATPQEEATYTMLKQILQNHVALHQMSLLAAAMAGVGLLGDRWIAYGAGRPASSVLLAETLQRLKQQVRTRQSSPALAPFVAASADDPVVHLGAHARQLYDALRQLVRESSEAQQIDLQGGMRVVVALMADILSMLLHQFEQTLAEVDTLIETVVGPALESYLTTSDPVSAP